MGRRAGGIKKNEKEQQQQQMIDISSKDQLECANPSLRSNNVSSEIKELTDLAAWRKKILENKKYPRRSLRIKNVTPSSEVRDNGDVVENVDCSDDEEEDEQEQECSDEDDKEPHAILCARSMEEKIDHLILIIEGQRKTIEALLSKGAETSLPPENPCTNDNRSDVKTTRYKEMYITSQKKIEELQVEKYELEKKLEAALAKLEGYEKGQQVFSEAVDKLKDAFLVSSLTKATEAVLDLSKSRAVGTPRAAKRKKVEKGSGN